MTRNYIFQKKGVDRPYYEVLPQYHLSMNKCIRFKRAKFIKKTISMPVEVFQMSAPRAAQFSDYSKYIQDLIRRTSQGELIPEPKSK